MNMSMVSCCMGPDAHSPARCSAEQHKADNGPFRRVSSLERHRRTLLNGVVPAAPPGRVGPTRGLFANAWPWCRPASPCHAGGRCSVVITSTMEQKPQGTASARASAKRVGSQSEVRSRSSGFNTEAARRPSLLDAFCGEAPIGR